ncbi:unnamed protein product [Thelazia callipaeda]|uniref:G_PROTEIN_RECEP_F1_2 domain-containing protein n=1 Tax=Thelazia callipaeda TaxID=103827 RepID=A0A0N5CPR5_THECL|nr:unnamed protein product [Thelazia callipaeda]
MYLRALAVADLLCMIFVLLFVIGEIATHAGLPLEKSYFQAFYRAHLMLFLINWASSTGVLIVVALSFDRFLSIVFPTYFRTWNVSQRAHQTIFAIYTITALLQIPYGIGRYTVDENINQEGTTIYASIDSEVSRTLQWQIYKWTREGLLRFAPILILSVLNIKIMTAFRRRQKLFVHLTNRKNRGNFTNGSGSSKDDTLIYILGGIVVMFFICNIPAALNLLFINETIKLRVDYHLFRAVANLLEITNHASQFYVFCACSTAYRTTFLEKFPLSAFSS